MPRRRMFRKKKRRFRRKNKVFGQLFNSRSYKPNNGLVSNYLPSPFPPKIKRTLRYNQTFTLDPAAGFVASTVFRANDLRDPDQSGTGHQPRYFDELMTLYNHFVVIGSVMTVKVDNSKNSGAIKVGIRLSPNTSASPVANDYNEDAFTRTRLISGNGGPAIGTLTMGVNPNKFLGLNTNPVANSNLRGDISNSPTEEAYFVLYVHGFDDSFEATSVAMEVNIDYTAVFFEPSPPLQS